MCVILSAKVCSENIDQVLADKEAILACLNIKATTFDDSVGVVKNTGTETYDGEHPIVFQCKGSSFGSNVPTITGMRFQLKFSI